MSELIDKLSGILDDGRRLDLPTRDIVRAILVTLREPNSDMRWAVAMLAAKAFPQASWIPRNPEPAALLAPFGLDAWKAMVDAALAEPETVTNLHWGDGASSSEKDPNDPPAKWTI